MYLIASYLEIKKGRRRKKVKLIFYYDKLSLKYSKLNSSAF